MGKSQINCRSQIVLREMIHVLITKRRLPFIMIMQTFHKEASSTFPTWRQTREVRIIVQGFPPVNWTLHLRHVSDHYNTAMIFPEVH